MEVVSACPLRVGSVLWKTATGALTLTVVAKATYDLCPAESPLAPEQDEPTETDEFWDDDERRSLHAPSDVAPFKRRADVILVGHAFAPGGQAVRSLIARVLVGEVDKSIEVFAERAFALDGSLREGARFAKMPLRWERAAGGPDTANPVGVRADGPRDVYGMLPLPNLQPAGKHVTSPDDFIEPIGFGPIAPAWPPRQAKLHQSLVGWDFRRWNARPLPPDLDPAFFNAAPGDQQLDVIRPNERIVLENLHPSHPRLVTSLASATPRAMIEWGSGGSQEFGMRCDTLFIDTDRGTCALTWRGQIPIDDPRRAGRVVITLGRAGSRPDETGRRPRAPALTIDGPMAKAPELPFTKRPSAPALPVVPAPELPFTKRPSTPALPAPELPFTKRPGLPAAPVSKVPAMPQAVDRTMDAPLGDAMPALPFRVGRSPLAGTILGQKAPAPAAVHAKAQGPRPAPTLTDTQNDEPTGQTRLPPKDVLPFTHSPALVGDDEETQTELPSTTADMSSPEWVPASVPTLPFAPAPPPFAPAMVAPVAPMPVAPAYVTPMTPPPVAPAMVVPAPVVPPMAPAFVPPAPEPVMPAFVPPAPEPVMPAPIVTPPAPIAAAAGTIGGMALGSIAPAPASPTPWRALDADARPPAAGPAAPAAVVPPDPIRSEPPPPPPMIGPLAKPELIEGPPAEEASAPEKPVEAAPPPEPAKPPPPPELPLAAYPLERCAAIAASLARTKKDTDRILKEQELEPDVWQKLDRHWTEHVRAEAGRGRTAPLKAYDAAYVAQLEKERGPIRVEEYARLAVAVERGSGDQELAALTLPRGALLRVQRVWLMRTTADAELGKAVRQALDVAREA
ncbi:MAG: DUF2169 domain-containing protein [Minicystis sp.]